MMRTAALAFLLTLSAPLAAEPLYNGHNAGAPESAVLPAFPTAKLEREANGVRMWRAEGVPLSGMWMIFEFVDGGLAQVTMHGRGGDRYVEVRERLRKRYGAPVIEGMAGDSAVAIWQVGTTRIEARMLGLQRSPAGNLVEAFTVTYATESGQPTAPF